MFRCDPSKIGEKVADGLNSDIYKYNDQGPEKSDHLVKCIPVKNINKLMQFIEEFALGFNNKHPFVLNYKGIDIHESTIDENKYMVYIKMKREDLDMRKLIQRRKQEKGQEGYFEIDTIIQILFSLVSALAYLEGKDVVHSNIMYDSVLFNKYETVKLAGFAFSKYKPWRTLETKRKGYQSYFPPEKMKRVKPQSKEKAKKDAFKSDVWCLGKLIIDLCLLRDRMSGEKNAENAKEEKKTEQEKIQDELKKIEEDLKKIQGIYHDKNLVEILESLLQEQRRKRPTFEKIRQNLNEKYPHLQLIEMENRKEEEPDFDTAFSIKERR